MRTVILLLTTLALPALAQPTYDCMEAAGHRQFDFWLGDWDVRIPAGFLAARDRITRSADGCVITQHWEGVFGIVGRSWSYYDATRETWLQTWVGANGSTSTVEGKFEDGAMTLYGPGGTTPGSKSKTEWRMQDDGSVRVTVWTSTDDGATWGTPSWTTYRRTDPTGG